MRGFDGYRHGFSSEFHLHLRVAQTDRMHQCAFHAGHLGIFYGKPGAMGHVLNPAIGKMRCHHQLPGIAIGRQLHLRRLNLQSLHLRGQTGRKKCRQQQNENAALHLPLAGTSIR